MSRYGLKFEQKTEKCVEDCKTHHILLKDDERSFVRDVKRHSNILIEGENYQALKVLQYTHVGKIDCIYIDPNYNTGNKDFVYDDSFVDAEDTFRHSKWLSFMSCRLELARKLLSERGVVFISIDDNECAQLKLLCDQVFGEANFIANMIWKKKATNGGIAKGGFGINIQHEYILAYAKNKELVVINGVPGGEELDAKYKFEDDKGKYRLIDFAGYGLTYQPSLDYAIETPDGKSINANDVMGVAYKAGWRWCKETYDEKRELIVWVNGKPKTKTYMNGDCQLIHPSSILDDKGLLANTDDTHKTVSELTDFPYRKPVELIKRLLFVGTQKDSIVLDFFAGSGTTGQAVAELNKQDGGTRQFILCTNNAKSDKLPNGICSEVTFPRLDKTIGNENLRVFKLTTLKMDDSIVKSIIQLELDNRITPILQLAHNTFTPIHKDNKSAIYSNHDQSFFLGIWLNNTIKQSPLDTKGLFAFRSYMKENFANHEVLENKPRHGLANDYVQFMRKV